MAWLVSYSKQALNDLQSLPKQIAKRIAKKIAFFSEQKNPLQFAKRLVNPDYGTYRFRAGDYRVIFDVDRKGQITVLLILSIKHRREVYRF